LIIQEIVDEDEARRTLVQKRLKARLVDFMVYLDEVEDLREGRPGLHRSDDGARGRPDRRAGLLQPRPGVLAETPSRLKARGRLPTLTKCGTDEAGQR
jgi:hypothetical protein